jgi:Domain of unknown function (DUF1788)
VSRVDDLIANYRRFVGLPWPSGLAPAQRVWMAVYSPNEERRLRLHLPEFETATVEAGFSWAPVDVSNAFEGWMAGHEYRDAYFTNPKLMAPELVGFFEELVADVRSRITAATSPKTIVALIGAGSLYGLGDHVKVSALIESVQDVVEGRMLVFFPGEVEGNNYRLLGARDGWNYLATLITAQRG